MQFRKMKMSEAKIKLRYVYFPFIIVSVVSTILFCILYEVFSVYGNGEFIKEDLWFFWFPAVFGCLVVFLFLRKNLRIIQDNRGDGNSGLAMMMVSMIAFACGIAVTYYSFAVFGLKEVASPTQIMEFPNERFFKIRNFRVRREDRVLFRVNHTSGKRRKYMTFLNYYATPFTEGQRGIWYGYLYSERIDNGPSDKIKSEREYFDAYARKFMGNFNYENPTYFSRVLHSETKERFFSAIKTVYPYLNYRDIIILEPHENSFAERDKSNTEILWWIFIAGNLIILGILILSKVDHQEFKKFKKP